MDGPGVEVLLDIDREYRDKARAGALRMIAPRRMNPDGKAWLPVLHTRFGPWHFTALFSNTGRRVVRGREPECAGYYRAAPVDAATNGVRP